MKYLSSKILGLVLLFQLCIYPQAKDPDQILSKVKSEFQKVKDYTVDAEIKVDVDFIKMPDRKLKIFFKQPDKFHIESENFALLPKEGLSFSPLEFLDYKYTSFYAGEDTINGNTVSIVKTIPLEASDVVLNTFWIDTRRNTIVKVESSRKPQGTFVIDLEYEKINQSYWLPSSSLFTFSIDRSMIPDNIISGKDKDQIKETSPKTRTGNVHIKYSNYKVNSGLSDKIFENEDIRK